MALTDFSIRSAQTTAAQQKLFEGPWSSPTGDGDELFLLIKPNGSKLKLLAIGAYGDVTLKQARDAHEDARRLVAKGIDPAEQRKNQKAVSGNTLEVFSKEY